MPQEVVTVIEGATIVDNPGVRYHLLQCKHALRIEVRTGMVLSRGGSVLATAQRCGYTTKRTKAGALADIEALLAAYDTATD